MNGIRLLDENTDWLWTAGLVSMQRSDFEKIQKDRPDWVIFRQLGRFGKTC
jgi:hypothetical protein